MTTTEILDLIEEEIGDTNNATSRPRLLQLLNRAHKVIVAGGGELNTDPKGQVEHAPHVFPWAISADPITIVLEPKTNVEATISALSNAAVINVDANTKDFTGYYVRFSNHDTLYKILSHETLNITLDSVVIGAAGTDINAEVFKLDYTINTLLPLGQFTAYRDKSRYMINILASREFNEVKSKNSIVENDPKNAGIVNQSGNTFTFRFDAFPKEPLRLEIHHIPAPEVLDEVSVNPILPEHHSLVLVHLSAFYELRRNDDDRFMGHLSSAQQLFNAMKAEGAQVLHFNDKLLGHISPKQPSRRRDVFNRGN